MYSTPRPQQQPKQQQQTWLKLKKKKASVEKTGKAEPAEEEEVDDEDGLYAKSLAQFMRKLPTRRKAQLRIEIEQLKLKYCPEDF
jgi:hypothetical protein